MSTAELLQIPEVRDHLSPMSVEEYHQMPERNSRGRQTELIRGIVIEKMPKSPKHSWLTRKIYKLIIQALGDRDGSDLVVWIDQPLTFIDSEPEPDIAVVKGNEDDFKEQHPTTALLVVEVAVTSLALDRVKAGIYAEAGILEYWIVDTTQQLVEVYRTPHDGRYTTREMYELSPPFVNLREVIQCQAVPEIRVEVRSLFPDA